MSRLRSTLNGTVQFDFEGFTKLRRDMKMFPVRGKLEIGLMLAQLDAMPPIGLFEAREADTRNMIFFGSKKAFEGTTEPVREHLNSGSRNVFSTTAFKGNIHLILGGECAFFLILLLHRRKHLIIEMPCLNETSHELAMLIFIHEKPIFKRSHVFYFTG